MKKVCYLIIGLHLVGNLISQTIISRIAGDSAGTGGFGGTGGQAILSQLEEPTEVTVDSVGNIYIVHGMWVHAQIWMIDKSTGIISTVVGGGTKTTAANGDTATSILFGYINGVVSDKNGNLYFSDGYVIYLVDKQTNILSIVAGQSGTLGYNGDNIAATSALISTPEALALDEIRNYLYIADASNHRVRKVDLSTGLITTVAGTGTAGESGDGNPAVNAMIYYPNGLAVDTAGNIYISDQNNKIRKVDYNTGFINLFAGNGNPAYCGNGLAGINACLNFPQSLAINKQNTKLYVADTYNHVIQIIDLTNASNITSTIAGNGTSGYSGDNGPSYLALLDEPWGVCVNNDDDIIIADTDNNVVRKITEISGLSSQSDEQVIVRPNPSSNFLKVESRLNGGTLTLFNLLGHELRTGLFSGNQSIDVKDFPPGVYFLVIDAGKDRFTKKVIIQH